MLTIEKLESLEIGDSVCDMHYGIDALRLRLPEGYEIVNYNVWYCDCGHEFILQQTGKQDNKIAFVVGRDLNSGAIVCNYAYDRRYFGVFTIQKKGK